MPVGDNLELLNCLCTGKPWCAWYSHHLDTEEHDAHQRDSLIRLGPSVLFRGRPLMPVACPYLLGGFHNVRERNYYRASIISGIIEEEVLSLDPLDP